MNRPFGWLDIVRLGLVQAALGAVTVLTISTLNRVMVVEWSLPALLPGVLVALHYAVQVLRPQFGYGSDSGGRRISRPRASAALARAFNGRMARRTATSAMITSTSTRSR